MPVTEQVGVHVSRLDRFEEIGQWVNPLPRIIAESESDPDSELRRLAGLSLGRWRVR